MLNEILSDVTSSGAVLTCAEWTRRPETAKTTTGWAASAQRVGLPWAQWLGLVRRGCSRRATFIVMKEWDQVVAHLDLEDSAMLEEELNCSSAFCMQGFHSCGILCVTLSGQEHAASQFHNRAVRWKGCEQALSGILICAARPLTSSALSTPTSSLLFPSNLTTTCFPARGKAWRIRMNGWIVDSHLKSCRL